MIQTSGASFVHSAEHKLVRRKHCKVPGPELHRDEEIAIIGYGQEAAAEKEESSQNALLASPWTSERQWVAWGSQHVSWGRGVIHLRGMPAAGRLARGLVSSVGGRSSVSAVVLSTTAVGRG